ncbi:protein kintoun [Mastacembelus armatus]|uniref:Protein kintoun n=1 Tax=Mastacembelus armatus TaxID=205130 RepID=A0A3Q3KGJ2_9TELE|nr:protein kintoun [Mastacembelus armatus]
MEFGEKLDELNMTVDEIDRFKKAFRNEKFRELLRDYAQEISDPGNKKRYEEEIKILEQERGNSIEFIHPQPFRALKTSVDGKQKCFINICGNNKVAKPECKPGLSDDGRRGQCWSLPHSLHPGRVEIDTKQNKITIYDVIFHPDTLHIASKNKSFMDMVDNTAIQGIQDAFKVTLDKNNVRKMNTMYKGTPQPCVIRKPIPGFKAKEPSEKPDHLPIPYTDEKRSTTASQSRPTKSPTTKNTTDSKATSFQTQPQKTKEPTEPNYTVKYRSFIDLQDFRCSRDSAKGPRPKEIVVMIDLPLVKSVTDISLEVKEKTLLLESEKPAYRLDLSLAYPVDEDKGEAKFNKQRGQLTVTLPVLPSNEALDFAVGPGSDVHCESDGEKSGEEEEDNQQNQGVVEEEKGKEERDVEEEDLKQQTRVEKHEAEERCQGRGDEQMRKDQKSQVGEVEEWRKQKKHGENSEEEKIEKAAKWKEKGQCQECVGEESGAEEQESDSIAESEIEEETVKEEKQENVKEVGKFNPQERQNKDEEFSKHKLREDGGAKKKDSGFQDDTDPDQHKGTKAVEEPNLVGVDNRRVASPKAENQPVLITAEYSNCMGEATKVNLDTCLESTPKIKTSEIQEEFGKTEETPGGILEMEADAVFVNPTSSEEPQALAAVFSTPSVTINSSHDVIKGCCISQETGDFSEMSPTDKANTGGSGNRATISSEDLSMGPGIQERKDMDEDNLPTEYGNKLPPALLREIDKDGNEKIISDHSTSARIIFQNTVMYELD